jgi:hypothetical protein
MLLIEFIRSDKSILFLGAWGEDKIRTKDFPLSRGKGKTFPLTRRYRWRVSILQACSRKFRLMVAYHTQLPEFLAVLAEDLSGDSRVLARLEFHQSHDGWHLHPFCDDSDLATAGIVKPLGTIRLPKQGANHRNRTLLGSGDKMNDACADKIVADFFRIPDTDAPDLFSVECLPWKI